MRNDVNVIWCPHCKARATVKQFPNGVCPQCRRKVAEGAELLEDPYKPVARETRPRARSNRFEYDQQGGSDSFRRDSCATARAQDVGELYGIQGRV